MWQNVSIRIKQRGDSESTQLHFNKLTSCANFLSSAWSSCLQFNCVALIHTYIFKSFRRGASQPVCHMSDLITQLILTFSASEPSASALALYKSNSGFSGTLCSNNWLRLQRTCVCPRRPTCHHAASHLHSIWASWSSLKMSEYCVLRFPLAEMRANCRHWPQSEEDFCCSSNQITADKTVQAYFSEKENSLSFK